MKFFSILPTIPANIVYTLILMMFFISGFAQEPEKPKVVVYKPFVVEQEVDPIKDVVISRNMIKWNYWMIGRGAFLMEYERSLKQKLSIEGGLGLTYRDFIFEFFREISSDDWDYYENKSINLGIMAQAGIRYYPVDGDMEGFYVSGLLRYRKYNLNGDIAYFNFTNMNADFGYQMTETCFLIGRQWEDFLLDVTGDFYMGVSYEFASYHQPSEINGIWHMQKVNKNLPALLFGMKIGLPF
jgi:hypothetical protein